MSAGALIHGAGLIGGFFTAKQFDSTPIKIASFAACTIAAGYVAKLLHQRETRKEKQFLGRLEEEVTV